ncbi:flagellar motor protein MotB [Oricola cellulosilytica]|uniref:flagellar motor protein MotB n=1 Tax=Oricola cellulosilytica TaxID=1429082 RepID=UPI00130487B9|nr:flagellar motor protein MotB [Oricola cellulosilytica]
MSESERPQEFIIIKRGNSEEEGHHGGAWKIAFADFMTAMMALFLVLWLVNAANEETKKAVASYFNPVKLVDRNRSVKGIHDAEGVQEDEELTPNEQFPEFEVDQSPLEKSSRTDSQFFADPFSVLDEIAAYRAPGKIEHIEEGGGRNGENSINDASGGQSFMDPFSPNFWNEEVRPSNNSGQVAGRYETTGEFITEDDVSRTLESGEIADNADIFPQSGNAEITAPSDNAGMAVQSDNAGMAAQSDSAEMAAQFDNGGTTGQAVGGDDLTLAGDAEITGLAVGGEDLALTGEAGIAGEALGGKGLAADDLGETGSDAEIQSQAGDGGEAVEQMPRAIEVTAPAPETAALEAEAAAGSETGAEEATAAAQMAAEQIREEISGEIAEALGENSEVASELSIVAQDNAILISLTDALDIPMFGVGSAVPSRDLVIAMEKVGKVLSTQEGAIRVRGHTDARQFTSKDYDNWRLSSARAQSAYYMLLRGGLPEARVREISGFADRELLDPENPLSNRNRRIEVLVEVPA